MIQRHDGQGVYTKPRLGCLFFIAYTVVLMTVGAGLAYVMMR